jgi:hypothetical protein
LESAISLVRQAREAHQRQKELSTLLDRHQHELEITRNIIQMVKDEEALHTAGVASELVELDKVAGRLVAALGNLRSNRGRVAQFFHQLVLGEKDEGDLTRLMAELERAKSNLGLRICVAQVGLTRGLDETLVVNTNMVERIDAAVQSVLGEGKGLEIAKAVRDRPTNGACSRSISKYHANWHDP